VSKPFNEIALSEETVHALAEFATLWLRWTLNRQRTPEAVTDEHREAIYMLDEMVNSYGGDSGLADMLPADDLTDCDLCSEPTRDPGHPGPVQCPRCRAKERV